MAAASMSIGAGSPDFKERDIASLCLDASFNFGVFSGLLEIVAPGHGRVRT